MSISTDPTLYDYEPPPNECPACFVANKTPSNIILSLSGILRGADWQVADPPAPNGLHLLTADNPCGWSLNDGTYLYFWYPFAPLRNIEVKLITNEEIFHATSWGTCKSKYDNDLIVATNNHYYSGAALFLPTLKGGSDSLPEVMSLLSEDPEWAKYANPQQIDDNQTVHKFYRGHGRCNVKILYER